MLNTLVTDEAACLILRVMAAHAVTVQRLAPARAMRSWLGILMALDAEVLLVAGVAAVAFPGGVQAVRAAFPSDGVIFRSHAIMATLARFLFLMAHRAKHGIHT